MNLIPLRTQDPQPLRALTLDDLWREAESLGTVYVRTQAGGWDNVGPIKGYEVKIKGKRRNTLIEVERQHTSLHCAFGDAINEAREMGLGEQS